MNFKKVKITVDGLYFNGKKCTCPIIELVSADCADINCWYDKKTKSIIAEIPEDCDSPCFTFWVICDEEDCVGRQLITKCLCDDKGDCEECENCIDGICVEECPKDKCLDDTCVECTEDAQCPCNQVCIQGKCQCAVGTKNCDADDPCCYTCCSSDDCEDCETCIGGECVPINCDDGICIVIDGVQCCAECEKNADCKAKDPNSCCDFRAGCDATCECCDGFVYDTCLEKCVPIPPNSCATETNCGLCENCTGIDACTGLGICEPINCPNGYVRAYKDGKCICVPECDCDDPNSCDATRDLCTPEYILDPGKCGCINCGHCSSNCLSGCECGDNDLCFAPCCNGDCETAVDCLEAGDCGCGCLDQECVECEKLSCITTDCDEALGCVCINGKCSKSECTGSCVDGNDCADGCTCVNNQCVSCDSFPCSPDLCSIHDGCACSGGKCEGAPTECTDSLSIENDGCTLTGTLNMDSCCSCPEITVGLYPSYNQGSLTFEYVLLKGDTNNKDRRLTNRHSDQGNRNVADNDAPASGNISYTVTNNTTNGQEVEDFNGTKTSQGTNSDGTPHTGAAGTFQNNTYTSEDNFDKGFDAIIQSGLTSTFSDDTLISKDININLDAILDFGKGTGCTYGETGQNLATFNVGSDVELESMEAVFVKLSSSECRPPLFSWAQDGAVFRKLYVDGDGTYVDGPLGKGDGLEACKDIDLTVDCGCARSASSDTNPCDAIAKQVSTTIVEEECKGTWLVIMENTCDLFEDVELEIIAPEDSKRETGYVMSKGSSSLPFTITTQAHCPSGEIVCVDTVTLDGEDVPISSFKEDCGAGGSNLYDFTTLLLTDGVISVKPSTAILQPGESVTITVKTICGEKMKTFEYNDACIPEPDDPDVPTTSGDTTCQDILNLDIELEDAYCSTPAE